MISDITEEFFWEGLINPSNVINVVPSPTIDGLPFAGFLYIIAVIICVGAVFITRQYDFKHVKRHVVISFIAVAIMFAARMDYKWLVLMNRDIRIFDGRDMTGKMRGVEWNDFYDFISFIKDNIPPGKTVMTLAKDDNSYIPAKGRYYLLPVETSKDADYIWIYDMPAQYEPRLKKLMIGGLTASPVEPDIFFREGAGLFKKVKE